MSRCCRCLTVNEIPLINTVQFVQVFVNMASPPDVCVCVCCFAQVSSSPASLQLLSILQTLLVLGPGRSDIWLALEAITNRAILLAQDCESARQQYIHFKSTL